MKPDDTKAPLPSGWICSFTQTALWLRAKRLVAAGILREVIPNSFAKV